MRFPHQRALLARAALIALLPLFGGCQGSGTASSLAASETEAAGRPVQLLTPQSGEAAAEAGDIRREVDEKNLARAVERYRLNLKQAAGPYRSVGVDLNSDGITEVLVLLEGGDWCVNAGCTLAIFTGSPTGYKPMSTIRRVWSPVVVTSERSNGWNDLLVNTGTAGSGEQRMRLRSGPDGYPGNAMTQTPLPADIVVDGTVVLEKAELAPHDQASNTKP